MLPPFSIGLLLLVNVDVISYAGSLLHREDACILQSRESGLSLARGRSRVNLAKHEPNAPPLTS